MSSYFIFAVMILTACCSFASGDHSTTITDPSGVNTDDQTKRTETGLLLSYRSALDWGSAPYKAGRGVEFAVFRDDNKRQVRGALHITSADFTEPMPGTSTNPEIYGTDIGLDVDHLFLLSIRNVNYFTGIRYGGGFFGYGLKDSDEVDFETYVTETKGYIGLSYVGLGLPIGMRMKLGDTSVVMEAMVVPTVHLVSKFTPDGFYEDIIEVDTHIPISVGLGLVW